LFDPARTPEQGVPPNLSGFGLPRDRAHPVQTGRPAAPLSRATHAYDDSQTFAELGDAARE
jgi:hypothetical protein